MNHINLDDYYSAGYFLVRKSNRPFWLTEPARLVSEDLISLESEFCPKFHLSWGWDSDRHHLAIEFGIDPTRIGALERWCYTHHRNDIDVWIMFHSTKAVQAFVNQFIPKSERDGLLIIGAGLHQSAHDAWQDDDETIEGVEKRILEKLPIEIGGQILGFEVASYAHNDFDHTWLSHGHHKGIFEEYDIRPNQYGLLHSQQDAIIARDYTNLHDGYIYDYWLLVSYPISSA